MHRYCRSELLGFVAYSAVGLQEVQHQAIKKTAEKKETPDVITSFAWLLFSGAVTGLCLCSLSLVVHITSKGLQQGQREISTIWECYRCVWLTTSWSDKLDGWQNTNSQLEALLEKIPHWAGWAVVKCWWFLKCDPLKSQYLSKSMRFASNPTSTIEDWN